MSDLVDFLRARLDEDEKDASHNAGLHAEWAYESGDGEGYLPTFSGPTADRVLAEVEPKRRIIEWAIEYMEGDYAPWNETCLQLLALPYADHPDYRDEWRV